MIMTKNFRKASFGSKRQTGHRNLHWWRRGRTELSYTAQFSTPGFCKRYWDQRCKFWFYHITKVPDCHTGRNIRKWFWADYYSGRNYKCERDQWYLETPKDGASVFNKENRKIFFGKQFGSENRIHSGRSYRDWCRSVFRMSETWNLYTGKCKEAR